MSLGIASIFVLRNAFSLRSGVGEIQALLATRQTCPFRPRYTRMTVYPRTGHSFEPL
jgi:hypothetical protein